MDNSSAVKKAVMYYYEGETLIASLNDQGLAVEIEVYDGSKREGAVSLFSMTKEDFKKFYEEVMKL